MPDGYWLTTQEGVQAHVLGDPDASPESLAAVEAVVDAAYKHFIQLKADDER